VSLVCPKGRDTRKYLKVHESHAGEGLGPGRNASDEVDIFLALSERLPLESENGSEKNTKVTGETPSRGERALRQDYKTGDRDCAEYRC